MLDVVAIFGPTGVGKTAVAIDLAQRLRAAGERPTAVSADSLQIYQGIEILTGAPSRRERAQLEHRLVSFVPLSDGFSAGAFARHAHREIDAIRSEPHGRAIVVGGTGLYLRAALTQLSLKPATPPETRTKWAERLAQDGPQKLHGELKAVASKAAARIAPTDSQRITRALELVDLGHDPTPAEDELWTENMRVPTRLFGLTLPRESLYRQIDDRVDQMVAAGAAAEVARAQNPGPTAGKAVGFRELADGDVETMKLRTRRYAKRQLTWMRKLPGVRMIDLSTEDAGAVIVASLLTDEI